ncbi:hypothetical protein BRC65_08145 [Halobacteriales archaeon QH_2_65_14]|nr:MAG: hypothetical protein BRC65_08145 [Halobacteriales archaeon QH_2_65_14]
MKLNRRTVLLGLGAAGLGAGGIFASGAFTSVEAERTVELDTSDDSAAVLSFSANSPQGDNIISDEDVSGTTVITIEQSDLNEQATTRFGNALNVSNGGAQDVGLSVDPAQSDDPNNLIGTVLDIEDGSGNSIVDSGSPGDNAVDLDAGNAIDLTIVVDLRGGNQGSDIDQINSIVFAARVDDHSNA